MLNKDKIQGVDISINYCGLKLQSPYILASGPLSFSAEGMIKAHEYGVGAVVTKTIRMGRAINPVNHIAKVGGGNTLLNCEKWADTDKDLWCEREIPMAKEAGVTVIASVGHTLAEAKLIVKDVERAGADMIELVSYEVETMLPMLEYTLQNVNVPVICKLGGGWSNHAEVAKKCIELGASGICAIDSIGPALKIDIEKASPELQSENGYGWLTGSAIRPFSVRINSEIARQNPGFTGLYGTGGCMSVDDTIEFLMVGSNAVGVCSVGILNGIEYIEKMCYGLSKRVAELGYDSLDEVVGAALPSFRNTELVTRLDFTFTANGTEEKEFKDKCIKCNKCVKVCSYDARDLSFPIMTVDSELCRDCGVCVSVCPTGALTATFAEQTAEDRLREVESNEFYDKVARENM